MKKPSSENAKSRMRQVFNQAKGSLKILEALEKDTFAKAKQIVRSIPTGANRKRLTNDKIALSLHKLGFATRAEVETLEARIIKLEAMLQEGKAAAPKKTAKKADDTSKDIPPSH